VTTTTITIVDQIVKILVIVAVLIALSQFVPDMAEVLQERMIQATEGRKVGL
jgi:hypothetical protein